MKLSKKQREFLYSLEYLDGYELKAYLRGHVELEVLLDPDDLDLYNKIESEENTNES